MQLVYYYQLTLSINAYLCKIIYTDVHCVIWRIFIYLVRDKAEQSIHNRVGSNVCMNTQLN